MLKNDNKTQVSKSYCWLTFFELAIDNSIINSKIVIRKLASANQ